MRRRLLWLLLLVAAALGLWRYRASKGPAREAPSEQPARESDPGPLQALPALGRLPRSQFYLEHDRFLPATDPRTVSAARAHWLRSEDEVFGVVVGGQARAYPIAMIAYHHVVNDVIRGIPIAVTY
jgi:hypothetical protein